MATGAVDVLVRTPVLTLLGADEADDGVTTDTVFAGGEGKDLRGIIVPEDDLVGEEVLEALLLGFSRFLAGMDCFTSLARVLETDEAVLDVDDVRGAAVLRLRGVDKRLTLEAYVVRHREYINREKRRREKERERDRKREKEIERGRKR